MSFDENSKQQLLNIAKLPFIYKWIAAMPDVYLGKSATIGSVILTIGAVIPTAVGVDLGCGTMAVKPSLSTEQLPDSLTALRSEIEKRVPHGLVFNRGQRDRGSCGEPSEAIMQVWSLLNDGFTRLCEKYPRFKNTNNIKHLATLGSGKHFIEVCLDEANAVWVMFHSGSRGVGKHFIELAKKDMERWFINLPDKDLAYIPEGTKHFKNYLEAV